MQLIKTVAAALILACALGAADDSFIGTWKLNIGKSKFGSGMALKSMTETLQNDGPKVRRIVEGTDGHDKPIVQGGPDGIAYVWDGKEHKVSKPGEPEVLVSATPVVRRATHVVVRIQGKVISRVHAVVSKDGNTLTEMHHDTDDKGQFVDSVFVLDKQ